MTKLESSESPIATMSFKIHKFQFSLKVIVLPAGKYMFKVTIKTFG